MARSLVLPVGVLDHGVQQAGLDVLIIAVEQRHDLVEQVVHAAPGLRREKADLCVMQKLELIAQGELNSLRSLPFGLRIPFVDADDQRLALVVRKGCDLGVLLGHALLRIDQQDRNVRSGPKRSCRDDRVALELRRDRALAPNACRVHDLKPCVVTLEQRIDCARAVPATSETKNRSSPRKVLTSEPCPRWAYRSPPNGWCRA